MIGVIQYADRHAEPPLPGVNRRGGASLPTRLSKTSIASFEQCSRKLWLKVHRPEAAQFDAATLRLFASGHVVGELARRAFPAGTLVAEDHNQLVAALARTRELLARPSPQPIFEGAFLHANVIIRADILVPAGEGTWNTIEVKNSWGVRPAHISDLASQCWVLEGCGVKLSGIYLRHPVEPLRPWRSAHRLAFVDADVGEQVRLIMDQKSEVVRDASVVASGDLPDVSTGPHCVAPYRCEFRDFCGLAKPDGANLRAQGI